MNKDRNKEMNREKKEMWINDLLEQLTLEEKIGMVHGAGLFRTKEVERLGIPSLYMSDGPMGVRAEFADNEWRSVGENDDFVSYLPCNSALASTWNRELARTSGRVLGEEARGRGKDVILAPGINIKRSPLCGRNFEYMSEDPYLIEEMTVPLIEGIQENDVAACVKHFAANSQETQRLWVDTLIDERTLNEIYFPGFRAAVERAGTYSLMGAYNLLNGEHCCMSKSLLNEVLRKQWKYDGTIISDWGAVHDTVQAAESALDIEMDVTYQFEEHHMAKALAEKIRTGEIEEALLDEKVRNILRMMLRLKMIGEESKTRKRGTYNTKAHQQAVLEAAQESIILLKNEDKILPLDKHAIKSVAVIGQNAASIHSNGGGSAEIKTLYEISPLLGMKMLLGGSIKVVYEPGYVIEGKEEKAAVNWQADSTKHITEEEAASGKQDKKEEKTPEQIRKEYLDRALAAAASCDAVIFVGGLNHEYDVEGKDREDMKLPYHQDEVIAALLKQRPDTVVVLYAGSPVEMPWIEQAKAVCWSYYAGMEGGTALAEILFGDVNPSGKLAETMIQNTAQCPAHTIGTFAQKDKVEYKEGVMVGYRYYDTQNTPVLFPFGHGLSYAEYAYRDLELTRVEAKPGELQYQVSFELENLSDIEGKEVVQVYTAPLEETGIPRPAHELRAFEKVSLKAGERKRVTITLTQRAFSCYDEKKKAFAVQEGLYEIQVGASSREIRLRAKEQITLS